jgi:putative flippase GtrA
MDKIKKELTLANFVQFVKLQLAGNVLFWGTYIGFFVLHELVNLPQFTALASASIIAHALFFLINSEWVFDARGENHKTSGEIVRFILFMGLNFFINLGIITALSTYLDVTPYIGQFVAAAFFTFWTFIGLKYWVFQEAHHHASLRVQRKIRARIVSPK